LDKEFVYQQVFVGSINKKLSNERFVNAVVDNERKKMADGQVRIKIIEDEIVQLKKM